MKTTKKHLGQWAITVVFIIAFLVIGKVQVSAHCDSFAGPVIKEALKALETNNVSLIYKWIDETDEAEINLLFKKTYSLRNNDKEIFAIAKQHFLETLVRLHRASEHEPYTGLKTAESVEPIIRMSDEAIQTGDINGLLLKLNAHITKVIKEKYDKMKALEATQNDSPQQGREYVRAYVDYIHTIQGIHSIIEGKAGQAC